MRETAVWLSMPLLVLMLLYGGLNLAEKGIGGVMDPAHRQEVFSVCRDPRKGPGFTLTFAGWTARFYLDEIAGFFVRRWDRLKDRPGAILQGKILDKTPAGWYFVKR